MAAIVVGSIVPIQHPVGKQLLKLNEPLKPSPFQTLQTQNSLCGNLLGFLLRKNFKRLGPSGLGRSSLSW
jgi:hypothetical protein